MNQNEASLKHDPLSQRNMLIFTAGLSILLIVSAFIFGPYVLAIALVAYAVSLAIELLFAKFRKRELDASWMVTPLVFALIMPPTAPLWMVGIGMGFGTFFGKSIFGGLGKNIFNPALVGALFTTISFPVFMNTMWLNPVDDVVSAATPLIELNRGGFDFTFGQMMLGQTAGVIGETFRLGILMIGVLFIALKVIDWRIPVTILATVFVVTGLGYLTLPDVFVDPVMSLFVGGLMFGSFFVATDPGTSPNNPKGRVIYAIGIGLLIVLIRNFAAFPEGVTFAVILMNAIGTLLDKEEEKPQTEEATA